MASSTTGNTAQTEHFSGKSPCAYDWVFWLLLLAFEAFLFSLPLLPNGDGPVHIYLSSILWKLAAHSSPTYQHFYAIRHLIQPYSFHYYLLILLEHAVSPDMAEKLFAGLIWATLALGFRTLARALGPGAPAASLLIFPLLFSWPLSAGFFNFTFACGLLLWALGFYLRLASAANKRVQLGLYALCLVLLILAHPIPLMVLICLTGLDLGFQLTANRRTLSLLRWQIAAFALACTAFVFPILIADKASVANSVKSFAPHLDLLLLMLSGICVSYFQVHSVLGWTYHVLIVSLLPVSTFQCLPATSRQRLRSGRITAADRLLLRALIFLAASLVFPETMNGSALFAARMWYMVWLVAAACVAAASLPPWAHKAFAIFGVGVALLSLGLASAYLRPVSRQQAELERAPLPPRARGLFFQPETANQGRWTHSWWGLNYWDGVRAFTAHEDVLLNTPWLQLTIVPVQENGRSGLLRDALPGIYSEDPSYIFRVASPREQALALADFLLVADPNGAPPRPLAAAAALLGPASDAWTCAPHDFYAICTRKAAPNAAF